MKNKISSFMDGELDQQDVPGMIEAIKKNDELKEEWKMYHLIGDSLRQSSRLSMNISRSVSQQLKSEPTILSPSFSPKASTSNPNYQKYKVFGFSIAASIVAMVAGWLVMHDLYEPRTMMVAEQSKRNNDLNVSPAVASTPPPTHYFSHPPIEINDYLFVHREFSPGSMMRGQITNVNSATEYHEQYSR